MNSIFDLVTSEDIVAYWEEKASNRIPYIGEELFDSEKQLGLDISWIKGAGGLPVVLKPSSYDAASKKRDRIGVELLKTQMPFFKESVYIDEEMRQQLNTLIQTGNQELIDVVLNRIFEDEIALLEGARAQRERLRMSAVMSGMISISANGQDYDYDYGIPTDNKVTVKSTSGYGGKPWSDKTAPIIDDIRTLMDHIEDEYGQRPERAIITRKTFAYFRNNDEIKRAIRGTDSTAPVMDAAVLSYIKDALDLTVVIYSKKFKDEAGTPTAYVPDDQFTMFPSGKLGKGTFGTTPEESDLTSGTAANVSITDVGVAVTTMKHVDPVNVETKVSMIYLPSLPSANFIGIMDVA